MVFSSTVFLFGFLPAVIICYRLQPFAFQKRTRNALLLFCSYLFYLYGAAGFLLILLLSTIADYVFGLLIGRDAQRKRLWLSLSVFLNIGLLAYFKYANFFIAELNRLLVRFGLSWVEWSAVVLPIGISFFTFQKLSYVIDIYRGKVEALENVVDFALYVAMFPKLIAGPIVRFGDISSQLREREESWDLFYMGTIRFCWGMAKKVIVANACGDVANVIFGTDLELLDAKAAWLASVAYTLQIYFDFSAYSDMAIGLGMLFGFKFQENFNHPYSAISITDFWRRWHISLSTWFRDYLYIPLGGNRRGILRTYLNTAVVCALCGLWHGARWTFLFWGLYHGLFLILERITGMRKVPPERYKVTRRVITVIIVTAGWVLFRSENLSQAIGFWRIMFSAKDLPLSYELSLALNYRNVLFMMTALTVFFLPSEFFAIKALMNKRGLIALIVGVVMILLIMPYCAALIVGGFSSPFIYYRF